MNKILKIVVFLGLILFLGVNVYTAEIEVESEISEVSVYTDSALINRVARLELDKGTYKAIFPDIIPDVDENSLRVSAEGTAVIRLFGAQVKKEYLEEIPSERIKQLLGEIQILEDEVTRLQNLKTVLAEKKKFLNSITLFSDTQIPQDLITSMPKISDLENILIFLDTELKDIYDQNLGCELEIRDLNNKVETLKRELSQISGVQKKLKRSITVELEVLKEGSTDLKVSYLVRGASWNPIYDARADFEKSEVELVSYGVIKQVTGEDWLEVDCALSTAKPRIGGSMPYVASWFLRPYQPMVSRDKMPAAPTLAYQTEAFKKEAGVGEEKADAEIEFATVEEKGIAIIYKLTSRVSVKSDKSEHKFPISS
ncbi:MAG: mucoidy inhibitor MuiA family protein, partial [Candidatus Atribacteria bacterium]|nr:mucoidy inhibitor MuiA family protein [Candidatus Atribacteria bacterium]